MSKEFDKELVEAFERLSPDTLNDLSELVNQLEKATDDSLRKEIIQTIGEILQPHLLIVSKRKKST